MKIAIVGNLAGTANEMLVGLRRVNIEADLFITSDEIDVTFEDTAGQSEIDPAWVNVIDSRLEALNRRTKKILRVLSVHLCQRLPLILKLLKYDVIHAHTGRLNFSLLSWLIFVIMRVRPYLAFATGSDLTEVALKGSGFKAKIMRDFFRRSSETLLLNGNMLKLKSQLKLDKALFFPFVINEEKYRPMETPDMYPEHKGKMLLYMMSRLDFGLNDNGTTRNSMKANDRLFYALDKYRNFNKHVHALVTDRGTDRAEARKLVEALNLGEFVTFIPPVSELERIKLIARADVVLDQFHIGGFGIGALQILAMGKPLITYYQEDCIDGSYGGDLPILNARSVDEIFTKLIEASEDATRKRLSESSRAWIMNHHSRAVVIPKLVSLYCAAKR